MVVEEWYEMYCGRIITVKVWYEMYFIWIVNEFNDRILGQVRSGQSV